MLGQVPVYYASSPGEMGQPAIYPGVPQPAAQRPQPVTAKRAAPAQPNSRESPRKAKHAVAAPFSRAEPSQSSLQGNSVDSHLRPTQHQRPHPDSHRFAGPPETRSRRPDHNIEDLTDSHDEIRTLRRLNRELTNENSELCDLNLQLQREIASLRKLLQNLPASRTEGSAPRPEDPVRQDNWRQPTQSSTPPQKLPLDNDDTDDFIASFGI